MTQNADRVHKAVDPDKQVEGHGYQLHVGTLAATSRGYVKLASADPGVHPRILMNYLSTQRDRETIVAGLRVGQSFTAPYRLA